MDCNGKEEKVNEENGTYSLIHKKYVDLKADLRR